MAGSSEWTSPLVAHRGPGVKGAGAGPPPKAPALVIKSWRLSIQAVVINCVMVYPHALFELESITICIVLASKDTLVHVRAGQLDRIAFLYKLIVL